MALYDDAPTVCDASLTDPPHAESPHSDRPRLRAVRVVEPEPEQLRDFTALPNWTWREATALSARARNVYGALLSYLSPGDPWAYPSRRDLAKRATVSVRTVDLALDELQARRVVAVHTQRSARGQESSRYLVRREPP
jgi:hypothetical protein